MKMTQIITVLLISTAIAACTNSKPKKTSSKPTGKTPAQIMRSLASNNKKDEAFRQTQGKRYAANESFLDNVSYTRNEARELKGLFPRLPNPDLCMYVFPHLSGEGATIPGYTSCFSMYEKNHYALPGETMTLGQAQY